MSWEIALTFGIVACAFSLLAIGIVLPQEHTIFKLFLIMLGLFILYSNLGLSESIIEANTGSINNTTISDNLQAQTGKISGSFLTITIVSLTYFLGYMGWLFIREKKKKGEDNA